MRGYHLAGRLLLTLLGVGLVLPSVSWGQVVVDLNSDAAIPAAPSDTTIQIVAPTNQHGRIQMFGFGGDPLFGCDTAGGTPSDPEAIVNHQILCTWQARGWNGSSYAFAAVQLRAVASEDWDASSKGTRFIISTTRRGTTVEDVRFQINDAGHIEYKTTTPLTVSACGTGAVVQTGSTDNAMRITAGSGVTECIVTFGAQ